MQNTCKTIKKKLTTKKKKYFASELINCKLVQYASFLCHPREAKSSLKVAQKLVFSLSRPTKLDTGFRIAAGRGNTKCVYIRP